MHVAVRADGGPSLGYGHLVRTSALATRLLVAGHEVTYATTTPDPIRDDCPDGVETVVLPDRADPAPFVEWLETARPDVVFTDTYPVDTDYQRAIREHVSLVVLQDDSRHAVCADAFVNGNLYADDLDYEFVGGEPRTCLGPDYALLRDDISRLAADDPPWRGRAERALVTMGGSDVAEVTPTAIRAFDGTALRVEAVVGPGFSEQQECEVRGAARDISTVVEVVRDPPDLPERMFRADFAVSTASTTTYELLALGTPIVSCPVVDNQSLIAQALEARDSALVLERDDDEAAFGRAIETYVTDPELRRTHRERGRELVDGQGAERVAQVLCDVVDASSP
ncbi:UDP-2,4-diacetamido-2,4,6-trideoxy-beta-L-altropyranose hydrolase [Halomicrobium mukohataei]|uniref:UDP-2,4-diacetamido-2,4, 6-trideoxy-beta-L-altropyranose hydrolase n=1 Tax=Halomicrobium mukohataei TaxID=57705 RepID=A0A847U012_9EURY|nr:UDP-2,4-diacetamido-2,4,6-trideoxy-beta-L-altropyranose hydrolase [Halomicrobium mukohataei]NLV11592.1 UDP-2,4-diacetamido-2,4,6-trideoxy-beta-L-altropyranose hydrolase [Halomicrobium mukohataei]